MADDVVPGSEAVAPLCPWCSTPYSGDPENCPSCGATLDGDAATDPALPGLTAIDAAAIVRSKEAPKRSRNRFVSWISGEYPDEAASPATAGALARPDVEVRREMLRLELEAEVARLQADADALMSEAAAEGRMPQATPQDAAAAETVEAELEAVADGLDATMDALEAEPGAGTARAPVAAADPGSAATDPETADPEARPTTGDTTD
jgi:hypothetical protein